MNEYRRNEVVTGAFVTLAIVLFGFLAFRVVGLDALGLGGTKEVVYVTHIRDAAGLEIGAPVMVAGIKMGAVDSIELIQEPSDDQWVTRARIEFTINQQKLIVDPQTATAKISYTGLLGSFFLAIEPGDVARLAEGSPPSTPPGNHPIAIRGMDSPTIASVLAEVAPAVADAKQLINNLDTLIIENDPLIRAALVDLTETSANVRVTLDELSVRVDEVLGTIDTTIEENRDHITTLLEDLAETSRIAREKIQQVGDDAERLLTLGNDMLEDNGPEVSETLRRLRRTMFEAEIAVRKIRANPAVLLFGDQEKLYDPTDYDRTWLRDTGRAGPYEQRDE